MFINCLKKTNQFEIPWMLPDQQLPDECCDKNNKEEDKSEYKFYACVNLYMRFNPAIVLVCLILGKLRYLLRALQFYFS